MNTHATHAFQYGVVTIGNTAISSKGDAPPATSCIILEVEDFGDSSGTNQQQPKLQTKSDDVCMGWWRVWVWSVFKGRRLPPSSRTIAKYSHEACIIGVHAVDSMAITAQLSTNDNEKIVAIFPVKDHLWEILITCDFLTEFTEHVKSLGHHIERDYYPGKPSKADVDEFGFSKAIDSSIRLFAMRVALARKVGSGLDSNRSKVVSTYLRWVGYHGCCDTLQGRGDHLESWERNVGFDMFRIGSDSYYVSDIRIKDYQ